MPVPHRTMPRSGFGTQRVSELHDSIVTYLYSLQYDIFGMIRSMYAATLPGSMDLRKFAWKVPVGPVHAPLRGIHFM